MKLNRKDKSLLFTTFICLTLILAALLFTPYSKYKAEEKELEQLSSLVPTTSAKENVTAENTEENVDTKDDVVPAKKMLPQYSSLYEENLELFGWISIEGTVIDYPVMQSSDNPEFYLNHAFDLSESQSSLPFLDADCKDDCLIYLL